ncbi:fructosamine kinase family protein [Corynebacterium camporealensis]|uniref:Fructosamine-3-kinase n=1 Tax=Corynebacterium camporealensis TaxID=161896 RepID=A0A0F6QXW5_9CORY|nr:fructosamine kinase family protein [Corynebacterium camporealensis]AKE39805.1 fructosamine-3-kinase [Corynebacterium camporealensis]
MDIFRKTTSRPDQAGAEAAGLEWLGEATHAVVQVLELEDYQIGTEKVREVAPTADAAREFGAELARMHAAGAPAFGAPPEGWEGKNFIGRVEQACEPTDDWGEFYAEQRVLPFARKARMTPEQLELVEKACELIKAQSWDVKPARIHGDLWAGNLLFGEHGGVMIDPAAHGGHPHTDLGMLALFGAPYLDEIFEGYGAPADIDDWIPLHQLHPLAVHSLTHGSAYHRSLAQAAKATIDLLG